MSKVEEILAQVNDIKASNVQIGNTTAEIGQTTGKIAADIERIAGGLTGGLSAEEADSVVAELTAIANTTRANAEVLNQAAASLKAVDDQTPEPTGEDTGGGDNV